MSRLDELRSLYRITQESLAEVDSDKRASLIREGRFLLQEIESLEGELPQERSNPLDELMAKRKAKSA